MVDMYYSDMVLWGLALHEYGKAREIWISLKDICQIGCRGIWGSIEVFLMRPMVRGVFPMSSVILTRQAVSAGWLMGYMASGMRIERPERAVLCCRSGFVSDSFLVLVLAWSGTRQLDIRCWTPPLLLSSLSFVGFGYIIHFSLSLPSIGAIPYSFISFST